MTDSEPEHTLAREQSTATTTEWPLLLGRVLAAASVINCMWPREPWVTAADKVLGYAGYMPGPLQDRLLQEWGNACAASASVDGVAHVVRDAAITVFDSAWPTVASSLGNLPTLEQQMQIFVEYHHQRHALYALAPTEDDVMRLMHHVADRYRQR